MTLLFYTKVQVAERKKGKNRESGPKTQLGLSAQPLASSQGELWLGFFTIHGYYHYTLYIFVNYLNYYILILMIIENPIRRKERKKRKEIVKKG
jgi:hypothetical protein